MWNIFKFDKFRLVDGKMMRATILGGLLEITFTKRKGKSAIKANWFSKPSASLRPVVYLKINKATDMALICFQRWIDLAHSLNTDFYIICDKSSIIKIIKKKIRFHDTNIRIMASAKNKLTKAITENLTDKFWHNATYAHLTPFLHSKQNNQKSFWNIDADDTFILAPVKQVAEFLKRAETYAEENSIDAFSLDMHTSRMYGIHWSFGITYVRNNVAWLNVFSSEKDGNWKKEYNKYDPNRMNLDWYMSYLRTRHIKNDVFHADNMGFIHDGSYLSNPTGSAVWKYTNGYIEYPILLHVFKCDTLGKVKIWSQSHQLGVFPESSMSDCLANEITSLTKTLQEPNLYNNMMGMKP